MDSEYFKEDFVQELNQELTSIDPQDEKRATALGCSALGHIFAGFITAQEWSKFAQAFFDKFNFPPTETVLNIKYHEFMGK